MYKLSSWKWTKAKSPVHASSIQTTFICLWCLIPIPKNWIVPNSNVSFWIVPNSIALNWIVSYSNVTKWIVPYSNGIKLNCALFQPHQIELCLIPMSYNWIVPYSSFPNLDCAFFQRCQLILCLNPMTQNWIVPNSYVDKWNLCLIPMLSN